MFIVEFQISTEKMDLFNKGDWNMWKKIKVDFYLKHTNIF